MEAIIDMLRNNTIFGRHSRGETRDFLERLEIEGYALTKVEDVPAAEPMPEAPSPSEVNDAARRYMIERAAAADSIEESAAHD